MRGMLALLIAASWAGVATAAPIKIEPVETLGAMVEFRDGMAGARSSLARSDAALLVPRATLDDKDMPSLLIAVENHGQAAFKPHAGQRDRDDPDRRSAGGLYA
jgi:hypothetical protein